VHPALQTRAGLSRNWNALPRENLQTRIKPRSNDCVRHIRRQDTHTVVGAGLEPVARKHVVRTYLPLDHFPPYMVWNFYMRKHVTVG
jgi:hypothetical protein